MNLICSKGVAGIGALTDHGIAKSHGWELADNGITHNLRRGGLLYSLRNYVIQNMGIRISGIDRKHHTVPFFVKSSKRRVAFDAQMKRIRDTIPNAIVEFMEPRTNQPL